MSIWGRLLGIVFGYMLAGFIGALIGYFLGNQMDKQVRFMPGVAARGRTQSTFFSATFSVMGHICKADGKVSQSEIQMARSIMQQMRLDEEQTRQAQQFFNEGKSAHYDLEASLTQLRQECRFQPMLLRNFIEIQLLAAYADGQVDVYERELLEKICLHLGFSQADFAQLEGAIKAHVHAASNQSQGMSLDDAYAIIGVQKTSTDAQVKKAYRRLMSQHHPDKLVSKGLPEEMMKIAVEKSQEIQKAYEIIQKNRTAN